MNIETILKIVALGIPFFAAVFGALNYFLNLSVNSKSKHREDYKFAKDFFADITVNEDKKMHPYLLEKGYQTIAGNSGIKQHEVEYLLTLTGAVTALKNYTNGRQYLKALPKSGSLKIEFIRKYSNSTFRKIIKSYYFCLYLIFAILSFTPLILQLSILERFSSYTSISLIMPFFFIPLAIMSVYEGAKMQYAEALVRDQKTHIEQINFPDTVE